MLAHDAQRDAGFARNVDHLAGRVERVAIGF